MKDTFKNHYFKNEQWLTICNTVTDAKFLYKQLINIISHEFPRKIDLFLSLSRHCLSNRKHFFLINKKAYSSSEKKDGHKRFSAI